MTMRDFKQGSGRSSRPITIACVIHSLQVGGSERVMAILANEFSRRLGLKVHMIIYGRGRSKNKFYALDQKVTLIEPPFEFNDDRRFLNTLRTIHFLRRTVSENQYDLVLSFGERWNNFVMLACYGLDSRFYLSDRSSPNLDIGAVQSWLRRFLYPKATGLIAQTSQAALFARKARLNDRVSVIPNPVISHSPARDSKRENIILSVGRLISTKHHDRLIKMFASLPSQNWSLVIVGDDAQKQQNRATLNTIASQLGVADRVQLVGTRPDIEYFYDQAKIFAFTSSSEGFPNVVAEALAAGLPVVSYDCVAGPSDLVNDGENGFLVKQFDDKTFCKRLSDLMKDEEQRMRMSVNAYASVAQLSPEGIATQILGFMGCLEP